MYQNQEQYLKISFHHICIETNCYTESINFYGEIFNFSIIEEKKDFHGRDFNTWLKNDEMIIELQTPKRSNSNDLIGKGNNGIKHVCFKVDDVEEAVSEIETKGYNYFLPGKRIYEVLGNKLSKLEAPDGTIIELRS